VRIAFPNGVTIAGGDAGMDQALSSALGRPVALRSAAGDAPVLEEYWPDIEGLSHRETVTDEAMPKGTFFDLAVVHVLTTATLDHLRKLYPEGRFEVRRFRPNIVVATANGSEGPVENAWVGKTLQLGDDVQLQVTMPCGRCVMTTLAQADLPCDLGILRSAVKHNQGHVGVYAKVIRGGLVRRRDTVRVG
jgi:uncharacterized protein YcbX